MSDIKLVFGIGNPDDIYYGTRHTIGIYFLKKILDKLELKLTDKKKYKYKKTELTYKENKVMIIISNCYMNESGLYLSKIMNFYKIKKNEIIIVHDDMSLKLASIIFKSNGSHHGHNGLKDVIKNINSNKFYKLKIGIGKPEKRSDNVKYVLEKFSQQEKNILDNKINEIILNLKKCNFIETIKNLRE